MGWHKTKRFAMGALIAVPSFVIGVLVGDPILLYLPRYCVFDLQVVDGDTIRCEGQRIRLDGFDAPPDGSEKSSCDGADMILGRAVSHVLNVWLSNSVVDVRPTFKRDSYGRRIAVVFADGLNVGDVLIDAGLAKPYDGQGPRPNWCQIIRDNPALLTGSK